MLSALNNTTLLYLNNTLLQLNCPPISAFFKKKFNLYIRLPDDGSLCFGIYEFSGYLSI